MFHVQDIPCTVAPLAAILIITPQQRLAASQTKAACLPAAQNVYTARAWMHAAIRVKTVKAQAQKLKPTMGPPQRAATPSILNDNNQPQG